MQNVRNSQIILEELNHPLIEECVASFASPSTLLEFRQIRSIRAVVFLAEVIPTPPPQLLRNSSPPHLVICILLWAAVRILLGNMVNNIFVGLAKDTPPLGKREKVSIKSVGGWGGGRPFSQDMNSRLSFTSHVLPPPPTLVLFSSKNGTVVRTLPISRGPNGLSYRTTDSNNVPFLRHPTNFHPPATCVRVLSYGPRSFT